MNFLLLGLLALLRLAPTPFTAPDPYAGTWLVADKDARVEIIRQGDVYTGRYVSFTDLAAARQKGYEVGGVVLRNMKMDNRELVGKVIDAETKKEYNAALSAPDANHVVLTVKVMGVTAHSETWTRVAAPAAPTTRQPAAVTRP